MPFKSEKQRRFMYAKHPKIAKKWSAEEKQVPKKKKETREQALARLKREARGATLHVGGVRKQKLKPKPKKPLPWYKKYNPFDILARGPLAPPKKKEKK